MTQKNVLYVKWFDISRNLIFDNHHIRPVIVMSLKEKVKVRKDGQLIGWAMCVCSRVVWCVQLGGVCVLLLLLLHWLPAYITNTPPVLTCTLHTHCITLWPPIPVQMGFIHVFTSIHMYISLLYSLRSVIFNTSPNGLYTHFYIITLLYLSLILFT